ncbi:het domain-containing protein [Colletotrichum kahawae]|uniref:Het domain-containing protein n=1 Tax=Colletotrichum kahawae TaxID=34407 RepID=A0AAD9YT62_COLKA|nr:het domain-containing protein [Colletotrichum kahawae]
MKLINVHTLEIEAFNAGEQVPRYAILSHTWGGDEISFHEWITNSGNPSPEYLEKDGCLKIINACSKTRDDKLRYLWVDTIYIDKSSSAELSEAINSMFSWYERATVCIVYMADVEWEDELIHKIHTNQYSSFGSSRWFTRGWTLQELLAPRKVFFFTKEWTEIGTKSELMFKISKITGIDTWDADKTPDQWQSVLAPSPSVFSNSGSFVATHRNFESAPYQVTNVGLRIKLPVVAAVNCFFAMLSVISTDDADPEHRRMMCLPLMDEGHIYRRCPFPSRPFPVHRSMVCETKEVYLLYKVSRNTEDLMPWPYRHSFEYGFCINILDESFSADINQQMITSVDCLVPQPLTQDFGGLILRINYRNERFLVFLSVSQSEGALKWNCEVLDPKFAEHNVDDWLREFEVPSNSTGNKPDCSFHSAQSPSGTVKILIALDGDIKGEDGRRIRIIYLVLLSIDNMSSRMQDAWGTLQHNFGDVKGRRMFS